MLAKLVVLTRDGRERVHPILDERVYVMGRGDRVDIRVPDSSASRSHCILERKGDKYSLFDLTSSNGTFLNGQRVLETTALNDGDEIRIGETQMKFSILPDSEKFALVTEVPEDGEFDPLGPGKRFVGWRDPANAPPDSARIVLDQERQSDTRMLEAPDDLSVRGKGDDDLFPESPAEEESPEPAEAPATKAGWEDDLSGMPPPETGDLAAAGSAPATEGEGEMDVDLPDAPPPDPEEEAFAQKVIAGGVLTEDQVSLARMQREMAGSDKPLGMFLVEKKLITWDQLKELLTQQQSGFQEEAEKRWTKRENTLFGKLAVKKDFISTEQLEECLAEQESTKPRRNLGEILVARGYMTRMQVEKVLVAQRQEVLRCNDCDSAYLIKNLEPGRRLKCKKCGALLTVPDPSTASARIGSPAGAEDEDEDCGGQDARGGEESGDEKDGGGEGEG